MSESHRPRPARLPELDEPVRALASDEGLVVRRTARGIRIKTHIRAGESNPSGNAGEGTDSAML